MTEFGLLLKNINRHVVLEQEEENEIVSFFKSQSLKSHQFLIREGEITKFEYFVIKGCLRSFYIDRSGRDHTLMFAMQGWWTGNLKSFLTGTGSKYNVQALEETAVLKIGKDDKEKMYKEVPKTERFFRIILQNALISQQERVINHFSLSAEERYLLLIEKFPVLEQKVSQRHIASYLGITPA